jgi:DNA-binding NarL/FixJ family response regulator
MTQDEAQRCRWTFYEAVKDEVVESFRIVLGDDHILFRRGMKRLIHDMPGMEVIGEANDGRDLLELLKEATPDLVILDISMPNLGGIEACHEIRILYPGTKVLILTMHRSKEYLYQAISAGANGYLLKEDTDEELLSAINTIREGGAYITRKLTGAVTGDLAEHSIRRDKEARKLMSSREREILKLMAKGKNNAEIADLLCISVRTVEGHRASLMRKLHVRNAVELVKYAFEDGLV